jgi:tetratricopeptide (TPR) repeat protein
MNTRTPLLIIFACMFLAGCASPPTVPEKELETYSAKKVMELGAQSYSYNFYDNAIYYYEEVDKIFTNNTEENIDSRAWAIYEIGYIKFVEEKYDEADKYFDEVLSFKLANTAPQILANEMKEKIRLKMAKN